MHESGVRNMDKKVSLDIPTCDFLEENIANEESAIAGYMGESSRTSSPVIEKLFHDIATEEMKHLQVLRSIKNMACRVNPEEVK